MGTIWGTGLTYKGKQSPYARVRKRMKHPKIPKDPLHIFINRGRRTMDFLHTYDVGGPGFGMQEMHFAPALRHIPTKQRPRVPRINPETVGIAVRPTWPKQGGFEI